MLIGAEATPGHGVDHNDTRCHMQAMCHPYLRASTHQCQRNLLWRAYATGITCPGFTLFSIERVLTVDENNNVNLGTLSSRSARYWPERLAVIDRHTRLTFAQLEQRANQLASALLAQGIATGEHVAILRQTAPNWWKQRWLSTRPAWSRYRSMRVWHRMK